MMEESTKNKSLVQKMIGMLEDQKFTWPLLRNNYNNLKNVKTKSFGFDGNEISAQFNPARILSSSADISKQAIEARPCFLCRQNLPEEQKILELPNNFNILCNPYPIFNEHFTVAKNVHEPQSIKAHFEEFLILSQVLANNFSVLYNGPGCGASAPDHMHFQAVTGNIIPIENNLLELPYIIEHFLKNETEYSFINDSLRRFIILSSHNKEGLVGAFNNVYNSLKTITNTSNEPLMNIIAVLKENKWYVIIFPRSKHRPDQYFAEGNNRLMISPAVVDLGGLVIVPREEDFEKITDEIIKDIFKQAMITEENFNSLIEIAKA